MALLGCFVLTRLPCARLPPPGGQREREILIDSLLVRVHFIIEMSRPALRQGTLNSLFQVALYLPGGQFPSTQGRVLAAPREVADRANRGATSPPCWREAGMRGCWLEGCTVLLDPRDPLLQSERTQGFAADPVYGRAKCLPILGAFKT